MIYIPHTICLYSFCLKEISRERVLSMTEIFDTIAAISTPYGVGGVALLRVSGEKAVEIAGRVTSKPLSDVPANTAVYRKITDPDGDVIDDAIVTVFLAPRSFTGEDTVEICCHGGIKVTESVLHALISAGARPAEAGEFTRRAFLSGKISLERAEAIGSLLEAKTSTAVKLFSGSAAEALGERANAIYDKMSSLLADMYARIDFPEEDLGEISESEITDTLAEIVAELESLLSTYKCGRAISEGIKTAIVGRTNAGKSSLYNRLVGRDAAIVTDIAGTTRDVLEETVPLGRVTLRLSDTAGLRESTDKVERIGIDRAIGKLEEAELVIAVIDGTRELGEEDALLFDKIGAANKSDSTVFVVNKCDGDVVVDKSSLPSGGEIIEISAKDGRGIDALTSAIEKKFISADCEIGRDALITTERQFSALLRAYEAAKLAHASALDALTQDLCSVDLERAMSHLSEVGKKSVCEEVVAKIFSKFCVGK